jgi:ligand-binding SRPBCC domain-containing protein
MLITKYKKTTTATPAQIWDLWKDVNNWKSWDKGLEYSSLEGEFELGAKGRIQPKGGPKFRFSILESVPNKKFSDVTYLPLTKLIFTHEITKENNETVITQTVEMKGPLSWLFSKMLGNGFKKDVPAALNDLISMAESNNNER